MSEHPAAARRALRAVIYVRLSSMREDDPTLSPQSQEEMSRAYCVAQGWQVVEVVTDLDESGSAVGKRLERPGLSAILSNLDKYDVIVARDLSRFARNVVDFHTLAEACEASNVALVSIKEGLDLSNATGRFVATILAAFAQMQAETTGELIAAHRAAAAKAGRYGGGRVPYGYMRADNPDGAGSILAPNPDEARAINRAVALLLGDGLSLYRTAETLNEEGLLPRSGKPWDGSGLKRVLINPAVRGIAIHRITPQNPEGIVRGDDGMPFAPFAPIMSAEDYAAVRALLERRGRTVKHRAKRTALLSGVAVCAGCGEPLYRTIGGTTKVKYDAMRCPGRSVGRDCSGVNIKSEHLETYVTDEYLARYGHFRDVRREVITRDVGELVEVEAALAAATDEMRVPGADLVSLGQRVAALAARRDALAGQTESVEVERDTGRRISESWEIANLKERQELLAAAIVSVEVRGGVRGRRKFDPDRVAIHWRGGDVTDTAQGTDEVGEAEITDARTP